MEKKKITLDNFCILLSQYIVHSILFHNSNFGSKEECMDKAFESEKGRLLACYYEIDDDKTYYLIGYDKAIRFKTEFYLSPFFDELGLS